jgi:hypothetical protein
MRHLERQEHHWKSRVAPALGSDGRRTPEK